MKALLKAYQAVRLYAVSALLCELVLMLDCTEVKPLEPFPIPPLLQEAPPLTRSHFRKYRSTIPALLLTSLPTSQFLHGWLKRKEGFFVQ